MGAAGEVCLKLGMPPETLDSLDTDDLKPLLGALLAQNKALNERIGALPARIAELESKLGQPPKTPTKPSLPRSKGQRANVSPAPREQDEAQEPAGRHARSAPTLTPRATSMPIPASIAARH